MSLIDQNVYADRTWSDLSRRLWADTPPPDWESDVALYLFTRRYDRESIAKVLECARVRGTVAECDVFQHDYQVTVDDRDVVAAKLRRLRV